ncbi:ATP binding [Rhizoctonia solani]|uniref:ATP binding n=1 Tax=Rhizoctonia solani TaxID=456999 RepID=A0A8H7I6T9_9AGAM|nr:ATP binding [Rhizoctonia solani]
MSGFIGGDDSVRRVRFVQKQRHRYTTYYGSNIKSRTGRQFIVCDAGGSTVDTAAYVVQGVAEGEMSGDRNPETATVTDAKKGIRTRLTNAFRSNKSKSATPTAFYSPLLQSAQRKQQRMVEQFIQKGEENFELHCKREFNTGPEAQQYYVVEAGVSLPENPDVVQSFFEDPVRGVIKSLHKQLAGMRPKYIFLVGGFGASKYLRRRVEEEFRPWNIRVLFLDDTMVKLHRMALSFGTLSNVSLGGAARMSFGLKTMEPYDPEVLEHVHRRQRPWQMGSTCRRKLQSRYQKGIRKNVRVVQSRLGQFTVALYAWVNEATSPPGWVVDSNDNMIDGFELVCFISAQISTMEGALQKDPSSDNCWRLGFILCIEFDGVELKARLEWVEKVTEVPGNTRYPSFKTLFCSVGHTSSRASTSARQLEYDPDQQSNYTVLHTSMK